MQLTPRRCLGIYMLAALPVCLAWLGRSDLIRMEPIIALGARHMLETREWLVPRLYGEVYAFKPPLAYWLAAASQRLLGPTELAVRLPTALCGIALGLALCRVLGTVVSPRCGLYGSLAAISSFLFIEQVRSAGFDMPLALGTGVAVLAACRNLATGQSDWRYWLLGYAGLLLGFLAKGLPAVLLYVPGLVVAAVALKRLRLLARWPHVAGLACFLAVASGYLYLAYQTHGPAAFAQHIGEIGSRAGTPGMEEVWQGLVKPGIAFAVFLPGSAVIVLAAAASRLTALAWIRCPLAVAAWAFLISGVVVLIPVHTSNRYFLPLAVPVAILSGLAAESLSGKRCQDDFLGPDHSSWHLSQRAKKIILTPFSRAALHFEKCRGIVHTHVVGGMVLLGLCYWAIYIGIIEPRRAAQKSLRIVAAEFAPHVPAGETVYVDTSDSHSSLFYYLDRPVRIWRLQDPVRPAGQLVVLVDEQAGILGARSDLSLHTIARCVSPEGRLYALGKVGKKVSG